MSEVRAEKETTYTIRGLTHKDMELICLGLDKIDDCEWDMVERKAELIETIVYVLPKAHN